MIYHKECQLCSAHYTASRKDSKFCSDYCRVVNHRKLHKEQPTAKARKSLTQLLEGYVNILTDDQVQKALGKWLKVPKPETILNVLGECK